MGIIAVMGILAPVPKHIKRNGDFTFVLPPKPNVTFQESSSFSLALARNAKTWGIVNGGD